MNPWKYFNINGKQNVQQSFHLQIAITLDYYNILQKAEWVVKCKGSLSTSIASSVIMAAEQLMDEMKVMHAQLNLAIIHLAAHVERIPSFWIKSACYYHNLAYADWAQCWPFVKGLFVR